MSTLLNSSPWASICQFFDHLIVHVIVASAVALRVCHRTRVAPCTPWIRPTGDPGRRGRPPGYAFVKLRQSPFVVREIRSGRVCVGRRDTETIATGLSYVSALMGETSARERLANRRHLPTTENIFFFAIPAKKF